MKQKGTYIKCFDCDTRIPNGYRETPQRCRTCYVKHSKTVGQGHHNFKTGRSKTAAGYTMVRVYDHPYANSSGRVYEHRLVMEQHLGRFLGPGEVVHHRDGNPGNNAISNLVLCQSQKEHVTHHKDVMIRVGRHAQSLRWKGYVKPKCTECGKPAMAKSLCRSHYEKRARRHQTV